MQLTKRQLNYCRVNIKLHAKNWCDISVFSNSEFKILEAELDENHAGFQVWYGSKIWEVG